jgi:hypothetical protein
VTVAICGLWLDKQTPEIAEFAFTRALGATRWLIRGYNACVAAAARLYLGRACTANRPEDNLTIAELIYEQVKKLPDQAAREVLDFVGYLRDRGERADWRDLMSAQSASLAPVWDNIEDQVWDNV